MRYRSQRGELSGAARGLLHLLSRQWTLDGWMPLRNEREQRAARELEAHGFVERCTSTLGLCARIVKQTDGDHPKA